MRISREIKFLLSLTFIVIVITFAFWLSDQASDNMYIQDVIARYGYVGIFFGSVISGFNLVVPIPAVSFVPALVESGLNYWMCILVLSLGMTVADITAYALGRAGRGIMIEASNMKLTRRLDKLKEKHGLLPVVVTFLFAAIIPFPNEILLVPLGFLRYHMWYLILALFFGNLIFNTVYSQGFLHLFNAF